MKTVYSIGILCLLIGFSCTKTNNVNKKLQNIHFGEDASFFEEVDAFPLFKACDSLASRKMQKSCFYAQMQFTISSILKQKSFPIESGIKDTLILKIAVLKNGNLKISDSLQSKNPAIKKHLKEIESILRKGLDTLPKVKPAIKYSYPVDSEYRIPLLINN